MFIILHHIWKKKRRGREERREKAAASPAAPQARGEEPPAARLGGAANPPPPATLPPRPAWRGKKVWLTLCSRLAGGGCSFSGWKRGGKEGREVKPGETFAIPSPGRRSLVRLLHISSLALPPPCLSDRSFIVSEFFSLRSPVCPHF